MEITVSSDEIKEYEKLKIISQLTPVKEKIRYFEKKYGCSFEEFEKRLKERDENFEEWDDYIEWKAYVKSLKNLEQRLREINDAKDLRIA